MTKKLQTSFNLDPALHARFKGATGALRLGMSEIIERLMTEWLEAHERGHQERGTGPSAKSIIKSDNQEAIISNANVPELTQKSTPTPLSLVPLPELGDKEWISIVEAILQGEDPFLATALKYNLLAFEGRAYERLSSADAPAADRRASQPDAVARHREVAERIHDFAARVSDGKRDPARGEKRAPGKARKRR